MENFKLLKQDETISILGYSVNDKGYAPSSLWPNTIQKLKQILDNLNTQNLSLKGRILTVNTLIISRIWYTATLLPPSYKQISELNKLISKSIKYNSNVLPRYSIFQQAHSSYGLQAPVLTDILMARMINTWIKLLTGNFLWAKIEKDIITQQISNKGGISINLALSRNPIKTKYWPDRWKPFVKAWKKAEGSIGKNKEPWPWTAESISLANEQGNSYSVKKTV
ncbi:25629_t:CDS:1 [Dentiscutata erythropus]|uniref:25629_t:CDS:1 n=1 Tax=Dentiscutata erythropus TaxID=1348616 RepID=A0A9N8WF98_9GLOM|nr:25629_t:CDS:1 [Dentiscutata erythropus]